MFSYNFWKYIDVCPQRAARRLDTCAPMGQAGVSRATLGPNRDGGSETRVDRFGLGQQACAAPTGTRIQTKLEIEAWASTAHPISQGSTIRVVQHGLRFSWRFLQWRLGITRILVSSKSFHDSAHPPAADRLTTWGSLSPVPS